MRGDARLYNAAIVGLALPGDQAALFHAVEEARHVRVVGDHAVADGTASQAFRFGAAKNAKDVVLRARKPRRFQKLFRFLFERVGGLQQRHENAVLQGDGGTGRFGAQVHSSRIVVITTIVKRKNASRWPMVCAAAAGESRSGSCAGLA